MIGRMDFFSGTPKREPSADQRKSADDMHAQYTAYVDAGFTKQQAMQLVLEQVRAMVTALVQQQRPQG
ncbi:MAG TPA: hypothetical protein VD834_16535 [Blastococcus sp.]|nr:hypothetical protein [Blastococcus sp.]